MQMDVTQDRDLKFWERMQFLIGEERPYPWAESKGINKSAFQSAKNRQKKPLPKTVKHWAQLIGCSYQWLNDGIGEPFLENPETAQPVAVADHSVKTDVPLSIDQQLLMQSIETAEKALEIANGTMTPDDKAEFISTLFFNGNLNNVSEELLKACISLIEKALKETRRSMSPSKKTELILVIYNFYYDKPWTQEHLKSALDQLIRSVS
ncbi:hypothetical protein [Acinetobacter tandoii]|uniref:Uncharacterized protein n=1 Tax=Acinetobacter tandoii DSM 14970 = CIP 107469 TaxID=1120927 RepID=R9AYJ5_9GAMM|nr:hypothetical protein [Acinetobacter tandoii]EOR07247.1 hypothetical protein I593_02134 [Acinetobacter tandoii DSM 14970 = CIP 107469]